MASGRPSSSDASRRRHHHAAVPLYRYSYDLYDPCCEFTEMDGSKAAGEPEDSDDEGEWEMVPSAAENSGETGSKKAAADARTTIYIVVDGAAGGEPKAEPAPGEKEDSDADGEWEMVPCAVPWTWVLRRDPRTGRPIVEGQCRCLRCYPRPELEKAKGIDRVYYCCLFDDLPCKT